MSAAIENGMRHASVEFAIEVIKKLESEGALNVSVEEAQRLFNFNSLKVSSKRSVAMKKVRAAQKSSGLGESVTVRSKPEMTIPFGPGSV